MLKSPVPNYGHWVCIIIIATDTFLRKVAYSPLWLPVCLQRCISQRHKRESAVLRGTDMWTNVFGYCQQCGDEQYNRFQNKYLPEPSSTIN